MWASRELSQRWGTSVRAYAYLPVTVNRLIHAYATRVGSSGCFDNGVFAITKTPHGLFGSDVYEYLSNGTGHD